MFEKQTLRMCVNINLYVHCVVSDHVFFMLCVFSESAKVTLKSHFYNFYFIMSSRKKPSAAVTTLKKPAAVAAEDPGTDIVAVDDDGVALFRGKAEGRWWKKNYQKLPEEYSFNVKWVTLTFIYVVWYT